MLGLRRHDGSTTSHLRSGSQRPCISSRHQRRRHRPRRGRSRAPDARHHRSRQALRRRHQCPRAHDDALSPHRHADRGWCARTGDESNRHSSHSLFQSQIRTHGYDMERTLRCRHSGGRALLVQLSAIRRAEPFSCTRGGCARGFAVVQLSISCAWRTLRLADSASSLYALGINGQGPAGRLSCAVRHSVDRPGD